MDAITQLLGHRITEQLYAGDRTLVYRGVREIDAEDGKALRLRTPVVIKLLRNEYPNFSELVQFRNQYTIAKNLNFPSIIQPLTLEAYHNSYALVMEDFGGISLCAYLKAATAQNQSSKSLSLQDFLNIALQLADTIHYLYQNRVIHKDIKPANILINPDTKQVKLIDFSIASLLPRQTQEIHNPNILEGTLAYLSPEQTGRMNRGIDYRSDFYSLGVTFYELLTGKLPFISDDPMELVHCHLAKQPISVHQIKPGIPPLLSQIVRKLLAKNAENRYQSALGLKHDLEICLAQFQKTGKIEFFELGQRDITDRFLIPEKLYGRETEIANLLAAFERVASSPSTRSLALPGNEYAEALPLLNQKAEPSQRQDQVEPGHERNKGHEGRSELMLVAGFSGIGKTAVVNEVHKPIVRQRGYFIKGKYDQFQRNIPLGAFVQAFRDLMGQLLSESDAQLQNWRTNILSAVGDNGQVLIEVIPELERIIGAQPTAPELSGNAAQNRFYLLMQKFVQVFTQVEHPLVMFLDDLQWADSASLKLLQLLMEDTGHLLVLGAYRDNEVSPVHPFILMVDEIIKMGATVNTIALQPLNLGDMNQLVADTLNCNLPLAQPLTELVYQKTKGNPFFATQFLKALHDDGLITFDWNIRYWQCDIAGVRALALTDDVVEFMALQLQKLRRETQDVLKLAACIGAQFDLATLAIVNEKSQEATATALWKALQEGLIIPTTEVYKFFTQSDTALVSHAAANPTYRFLHDRVQQAAYSLIPDEQKQVTHWKIGKLLLNNIANHKQEEKLFEIVNQLNIGKGLITELSDRIQLVKLNLSAGMKAKASNAYAAAVEYSIIGLQGLSSKSWQTHYELTLALHELVMESLYLSSDFERIEPYTAVVLQEARTLLDKVPVYNVKIHIFMAQSRHQDALKVALAVLNLLGIELPDNPNQSDIEHHLEQTKCLLVNKTPTDLLELPEMSDVTIQAAMQILSNIISAAYQAAPILFRLIVLKQVQLSITYGNAPESTYAYSTYGLMLCGVLGDIDAGYELGQLALQLVNRLNAVKQKSRTIFAVNCFIRHWKVHLKETLTPLLEAYTCGLETGDIEYAMMSAYVFGRYAYLSGQELVELSQAMTNYGVVMSQLNQTTYLNFNGIYHQSVLNLLGWAENPCLLIGESYDEATMLPLHYAANQISIICQIHFCKLILSYLFSEYSQALKNATIVKQYIASVTGLAVIPAFYFYESLTHLALYKDAPVGEQPSILEAVTKNQEKLWQWAQSAPTNYAHKFDLVEAEKHRVLGNKAEAIEMYDRAISLAKENQFLNEEALANELTAKFYLEWGKEKVAQAYMIEAYYCYARWGAKAKVDDLEKCYPQLLARILGQARSSTSLEETIALGTITSKRSSSSVSEALDLATLLKASQAISGEIELNRLLTTLLKIVITNAGASKCVLLLKQDIELQVAALVKEGQEPELLPRMPLESSQDVAISLVNTVKRSLKPLVVFDARVNPQFAGDSYIEQHQPKSVLCSPIINQGKLIGILYLENNVTVGAFTSDRVEVLNLICAQAAISLENARLYQQAQQAFVDLKQAQLQIIQSEKMSALGNLVAGVAHEINNPVGFLNGNIKPALNYVQDLFGLLDLYQQKYPQPDADIQEEIERIDLDYIREDLPKLVGSMKEGVKRIKDISISLRTFSRADSDRPVACNLHEGLDSTLLILKHRLKANSNRPEIQVIKNYGELPQLKCFAGQLTQVFMNLFANSIDALEEANQGRSFAEIEANPNQIIINTELSEDRQSAVIRIRDNGMGMSDEVKQKIFDYLFTTKGVGKGTGIGLAIARQIIVEKHGGSLNVNSTLGQGTEFIITLPTKAEQTS